MLQPLATSIPCEAHRYHWPKPTYQELHHVVPQSWQRFWTLGEPTTKLWDPRTVPLCRTGHGNVHWHLVRLMQVTTEDPLETRKIYRPRGKEYEIAYLALSRWKEAGGSLVSLQEAGKFGQI